MVDRKRFFSCALGLLLPIQGLTQGSDPVTIIEPRQQPVPAKAAKIDTEKFQVGVYLGSLSVEDFNTNLVQGLSFSYQLHDDYLLLLHYGQSDVERSTFERREELNFLSDSDRELSYLVLSGGYRLFSARSFLGENFKYDSDVYLLAGFGELDYAGYKGSGFTLGASYRLVATDWLVTTLDIKDHIYESRDVFGLGDPRTTHNIEFSIGLNALFF